MVSASLPYLILYRVTMDYKEQILLATFIINYLQGAQVVPPGCTGSRSFVPQYLQLSPCTNVPFESYIPLSNKKISEPVWG